MDSGLGIVLGMSLAYLASFMGLALAWYGYRKHHKKEKKS
jgi:hypothetical protein